MEEKQKVSILVVPFPAQGHLNQLLHFSLLLSSRGFPVHYASTPTHVLQAKSRVQGWNPSSLHSIHFHSLPIPPFPNPPPDQNSIIKFPSHLFPAFKAFINIRAPLSSLLQTLSSASTRLVIVHDPLSSFAGKEAESLPNAESYTFQCLAAFYRLTFPQVSESFAELLRAHDLVLPARDSVRTEEAVEFVKRSYYGNEKTESGTIINTCMKLEGEFLELLRHESDFVGKKIFAVGPVNPIAIPEGGHRHECLDWLDKQPVGSVLYLSFGSTTMLSENEVEQLAIGLVQSRQRFIWVLKSADRGNIFAEEAKETSSKLPPGFGKEVEGRGIVIRDWAPQLDILAHKSTGLFMSHCGWNSCLESLSMGVPIAAWPMHSDQPVNAFFVTKYLKVGVMVREWDRREELVMAKDIVEAINKIMVYDEGKEIKQRINALGEAVRAAVSDGGVSNTALESFIAHITRC
ncbi:cis-zeatin O-glucosyltransferase 1-like [Typha angustifolia]|uniref:cis-zeatin O-glucosyltransferase 1-like n=1 Tax=Typha angustifolia TaxID=59011 RepID=UPI003C2C007D